jgi:putative dimethyl sulfoxide reductase chaperone
MLLIDKTAAAERVGIYGFLAGVFCSTPTPKSVRVISETASALGISCPEGVSLRHLEREFMDLFVVPNPRYVAPYESVYRDRWLLDSNAGTAPGMKAAPLVMERLLMGESTVAVRQAYLQVGILPEEELPDHIANELRFMAHLWARQADATASDESTWVERRERFRREHLLQWIGRLREKVAESDRLGYYRAALEVAEAVLRDDAD